MRVKLEFALQITTDCVKSSVYSYRMVGTYLSLHAELELTHGAFSLTRGCSSSLPAAIMFTKRNGYIRIGLTLQHSDSSDGPPPAVASADSIPDALPARPCKLLVMAQIYRVLQWSLICR